MREIKFRAWDTKDKHWEEFFFVEASTGYLSDGDAPNYGSFGYPWKEPDKSRWVLMQYTGLKDKNGKEIYEGDIVSFEIPKIDIDPEDPLITNYVCRVISDDGTFCLLLPEGNYPLCEYLNQELKVIGNVYENPELLKGGD